MHGGLGEISSESGALKGVPGFEGSESGDHAGY